MLAHGINHIRPNIDGTAGWFGSMGMKPPKLQAWLASVTEIGSGILLLLGLLTPFAAAGIVGVMAVAWAINHRGNGFFIFRPGEGWEYVMTLGIVGIAIGALGPGQWSLDEALDIRDDLVGHDRPADRRRRRHRWSGRAAAHVLASPAEDDLTSTRSDHSRPRPRRATRSEESSSR